MEHKSATHCWFICRKQSTMSPPRFDHRQLILRIMDEGDVDGVINEILEKTKGDPPKRREQVFKNIRTRIMRNREYIVSSALDELRQLIQSATGPDKATLEFLSEMPFHNIHWAQNKPSMLVDQDIEERFKSIKFFKDNLYRFECPLEIRLECKRLQQQDIEDTHMHKKRPVEEYHFSETEVEKMVTEAEAFICSEQQWVKRNVSLKLLDCLSLVSGRRKWELCSTLKVKSVPERDYQAQVSGIAKRALKDFSQDVWFTIPLLVPIEIFIKGLAQLRQHPHTMGKYAYPNPIFPKMRHTCYRNIFSTWAWKNRTINRFLEGQSCSELGFRSMALCIPTNTVGAHYSVLVFDNTEEPKLKRNKEE